MADIEKNVRTEEGTDAKELPKKEALFFLNSTFLDLLHDFFNLFLYSDL